MLTTIKQLAVTFKYLLIYIYNKELYVIIYKTLILLQFVFIMELVPFKDNASDLDILKSLHKLWDCKYLTKLYIEITP